MSFEPLETQTLRDAVSSGMNLSLKLVRMSSPLMGKLDVSLWAWLVPLLLTS